MTNFLFSNMPVKLRLKSIDNWFQCSCKGLNKLAFACIVLIQFAFSASKAQTVDVRATSSNLGDGERKGYAICVELDRKTVLNAWQKTLRDTKGKMISEKGNVFHVRGAQPQQFFHKAVNLSSKVEQTGNCMVVFLAGRDETEKDLAGSDDENLKKFLYEFGIQVYRSDINEQIAQAEKVVDLSVKAQEKKVSEGGSIKNKLARSYKERQKLIQNLEDNAINTRNMKQDSIRNLAEQEQALEEIKKVRQVLEQKKAKLTQIK